MVVQSGSSGCQPKPSFLVLCSQSLFRFSDLGDDGIGLSGPHERSGLLISLIDVAGDGLDELSHA